MKALVKTSQGFGNLEVQDKPEPYPQEGEVKIKVAYAGICGTDIHAFEGHYNVGVPVTLGHEFSGVVAEVGSGVTKFSVGDRVTSETTYRTCGECRYCKSGDYNLCNNRFGIGTKVDGGFAEYLVANASHMHHLPDRVSDKSASMTEPLACTYHAVDKVDIQNGDVTVVLGPGPIGLLTAQVAKSRGARVIITGLTNDQVRLEKAQEIGIDRVVNTEEEDLLEIVNDWTESYGADVVFDCTGAPPAANEGLNLLKKKGQYGQIGIFAEPKIDFDLDKIIQKEIRVVGSRSQKAADWEPSIRLLEEGEVKAEELVTHEYDISQWEEAYNAIKSGEAIKVLLTPIEE